MTSHIQNTGYVLLRPMRVDVPCATGNLDLDGTLNLDMLCREQMPQKIGYVSPDLLRPHFMPHKSFDQLKLEGDDRVLLHGPLVIFAASMQQSINYLFSRNPEQYLNSQMTAFSVMLHIPAGDAGHVPQSHVDAVHFRDFVQGTKKASISCVYATDIPTDHFPQANKHLSHIVKREGQALAESEELPRLLRDITTEMKPLVYNAGDIVVHSNAGVHRSGRTDVAVNRIFQSATLRPDNDCRPSDISALKARLQKFGLD